MKKILLTAVLMGSSFVGCAATNQAVVADCDQARASLVSDQQELRTAWDSGEKIAGEIPIRDCMCGPDEDDTLCLRKRDEITQPVGTKYEKYTNIRACEAKFREMAVKRNYMIDQKNIVLACTQVQ